MFINQNLWSPWRMLPAPTLPRFRLLTPTAPSRGTRRKSTCSSWREMFNRLRATMLVAAPATRIGQTCTGLLERRAIPPWAITRQMLSPKRSKFFPKEISGKAVRTREVATMSGEASLPFRRFLLKNSVAALTSLIVLLLANSCSRKTEGPANLHIVRCAVIGGMTMTGLWPEIAKMFEEQTGYKVEVIVTGPRPILDEAMRAGKVDLLTMHSGDITTDLVADGYGINMRPWTRNELCIVGPPDDPAHIRGMTNGAAALRQIAAAHARFVDFQGIGSRELVHTLWRLAEVEPKGEWVLKDETLSKWNILQFAR